MASKKAKRGRKPDAGSKSAQIRDLLKAGVKPMDIAKQVGCTPALVYNIRTAAAGGSRKKAGKRKVGRPIKTSSGSDSGLDGILAAVQSSEKERVQLRRALERIQLLVAEALA